jgi:hypothetical protein
MNISRPTFHRILARAHKKLAEALFYGKALAIGGGNVALPKCEECEIKCVDNPYAGKVCKRMLTENIVNTAPIGREKPSAVVKE